MQKWNVPASSWKLHDNGKWYGWVRNSIIQLRSQFSTSRLSSLADVLFCSIQSTEFSRSAAVSICIFLDSLHRRVRKLRWLIRKIKIQLFFLWWTRDYRWALAWASQQQKVCQWRDVLLRFSRSIGHHFKSRKCMFARRPSFNSHERRWRRCGKLEILTFFFRSLKVLFSSFSFPFSREWRAFENENMRQGKFHHRVTQFCCCCRCFERSTYFAIHIHFLDKQQIRASTTMLTQFHA